MSGEPRIEEHELHSYIDEALTPERRAEIDAFLATDPAAAARVEAYRHQNELLRAALDPLLSEPLPPRFLARPARPRFPAWLRYGAFAASLLLAGALGWVLRGAPPPPGADFGERLAQRAASAHAVYVPEVLHPVEVEGRQEAHLVGWLSKRLGVRLRAPNLESAGFHLVGGRLLPGDARPAAQLMYEDAQGRRLTLYVSINASRTRQTAFRYAATGGVSTFYWIDGRLGYALSGELQREPLLRVAEAVYRELTP